jgi:hypothetical protein
MIARGQDLDARAARMDLEERAARAAARIRRGDALAIEVSSDTESSCSKSSNDGPALPVAGTGPARTAALDLLLPAGPPPTVAMDVLHPAVAPAVAVPPAVPAAGHAVPPAAPPPAVACAVIAAAMEDIEEVEEISNSSAPKTPSTPKTAQLEARITPIPQSTPPTRVVGRPSTAASASGTRTTPDQEIAYAQKHGRLPIVSFFGSNQSEKNRLLILAEAATRPQLEEVSTFSYILEHECAQLSCGRVL